MASSTKKTFGTIWTPLPSGLVVPTGHNSERTYRTTFNFVHAKSLAQEVSRLYQSAGIVIPPTGDVARLISIASSLSDAWLTDGLGDKSIIDMFYTLHLTRLADAVLPLADVANRARYLRALLSGGLDFFTRGRSSAKDIFWELELWSSLQRRPCEARLVDPPDIVLRLGGGSLGIACKKVYSEENLPKTLSNGVRQIKDYDAGIVAIDVDELIPAQHVLKVKNWKELRDQLQRELHKFLSRHEGTFRKYLSVGRMIGALVSIHGIAEVVESDVPINNVHENLMWVIPGLPKDKQLIVNQFERLMTG